MTNEERVVRSYILMNKLKYLIRTGWKDWNVSRDRIESVAEHVFSVQQLALFMYLTYEDYKDININKVIMMLAFHETEEAFIGDLTMFQISKEEKDKLGHQKVHDFFSIFDNSDLIENLIYEFDRRETNEAKFAYLCDKLDADLQAALYNDYVDLNNQDDNNTIKDEKVKKLLKNMSFGEMWLTFGQSIYPYDDNFINISDYAKNNINDLKNI